MQRLRTAIANLFELVRRTVKDSLDDRLPGLGAELAFYVVLALPPLLLVTLGIVSYVGAAAGPEATADIKDTIIGWVDNVFTEERVSISIEPAIDELLERGRADILTIGALLALWSASRASRVLVDGITLAYDIPDDRPFWRRRALGLTITAAGVLAVAFLLPLLVVGPRFGASLADRYGLERAFEVTWSIVYWPLVAVLGVGLLAVLYHVAPPRRVPWLRSIPGALLALGVWILGSFGLRLYVTTVITTDSVYSVFSTPFVLLLWVYVTTVALLVGAELNAEIDKMWPPVESSPRELGSDKDTTEFIQ